MNFVTRGSCDILDDMQRPFEFLCRTFPQVDRRVIKATVLEHGDDIESAVTFLVDSFVEGRDASYVIGVIESYKSFLHQIDQSIDAENAPINGEESCENIRVDDGTQTSGSLTSIDNGVSKSERTLSRMEFQSDDGTQTSGSLTLIDNGVSKSEGILSLLEFQSADMSDEDTTAGTMTCGRSSNSEIFRTECSESRSNNNLNMVGSSELSDNNSNMVGSSELSDNDSNIIGSSELSTRSLEELVSGAQKDKEYVMSLIKAVGELQFKVDMESTAAETAKAETARNEKYFRMRTADTQRRMQQLNQDNLVRRGELYGEKAVLALEMRELKVRLEQVKQQKERAVGMLLDIQAKLQAAYKTALEEREHAEIEKKMKEEMGQQAFALEEALLAVEEQETKKLDMEAVACARLRGSLLDHGSTIDVMQGEMAVLCEDIETFKKRLDDVGEWSSMSTASSHSILNSGMPYSFRKCCQPISDSSQKLRKTIDSDKLGTISNLSIDAVEILERSDIAPSLTLNIQRNDDLTSKSTCSSKSLQEDTNEDCFHSTFNIEVIDNIETQIQSLDNTSYGPQTRRLQNPENELNAQSIEDTDRLSIEQLRIHHLSDGEVPISWNLASDDNFKPVDHWVLTGKQLEETSSSTSSLVKVRIDDVESVSSLN